MGNSSSSMSASNAAATTGKRYSAQQPTLGMHRELARRHVPPCYRGGQATQARIALWYERASRTVGIAQGLEQAATESFELMEAVLHSQSWDHRLVTKLHDGKLKEMELEPSWQRSQQVEQVESAQGRLQVFMAKIQRQEREDRFKMSKEKRKRLRLKRQDASMTAIDNSNINA